MEKAGDSRKRFLAVEQFEDQKETNEQPLTNLADAIRNVFDEKDEVEEQDDKANTKKKCPILVSMINKPPRAENSDVSIPSSSTHHQAVQQVPYMAQTPNAQGFVQFLMIYNAYQQLMTKCNQTQSGNLNTSLSNFAQTMIQSHQNSSMDRKDEIAEQKPLSETDILREATQGKYKNVLCVICKEWICARSRKNHIEAHLNYRPFKCSYCDYARRREIFVSQHIKTHHPGQENVHVIFNVDDTVSKEVNRLAEECVEKTKKILENANRDKEANDPTMKVEENEQKIGDEEQQVDEEEKVVVIESVNKIRATVVNYHRRQRTKDLCLEKIYDSETTKQTQLMFKNDVTMNDTPQ